MKRGQHEMAGLPRRERHLHGLGIAHLADDDNVGSLPQRRAERGREIRRVDADLNLLDDAAMVEVLVSIGSSIVTMCRASRRLISSTSAASVVLFPEPVGPPMSTRPRGSRAAVRPPAGKPERRQPRHTRRQQAHGGRGPAALAMQVDPESADAARSE